MSDTTRLSEGAEKGGVASELWQIAGLPELEASSAQKSRRRSARYRVKLYAKANTAIRGKRLYDQTNTKQSTASRICFLLRIKIVPRPRSASDYAGARVIDIRYRKCSDPATSHASHSHLKRTL